MAEEKKIENSVYEYGELEERTERRPATVTPYEREICQHMEGLFPHRVTRVYREIDSEFLSVNVFVMKAPTKKDFHVLYTAGMSTDISWQVWNLASPVCPLNPFRPGETLSLAVWAARTEGVGGSAADVAAAASAVLMIMVLVFSIGARLISAYISKKTEGEKA